ncbi:hemin ABC transporter substrate-binding protein [Streptomyces thermocarboxydus]|uniref:ABC transporter substrate-binding protein n=1 Tax=Streptomyces thermocarboxydus TaxID=59299 RepID=A0ABU3J0S9_9ACTN|nr:ABC transporter substrate-binding protein [Streptomyces thermocarboxydus]UVT09483.1 ABC transporter substrate-binding protein [Streptomyces thermocarboxydus]WSB41148.1 ABC transporter substrate-binding protein [Streptomyces cellulosae]WTF20152.1 ABC transporter substrate-binding protein [Streptomyces cellulosae]
MRRLRTNLAGALLSVLALALTTTACSGSSDAASSTPAAASAATADRVEPLDDTPEPKLPVSVRSADGREVTVQRAERVVPLSGSLSEIVFTLGLGERVVARDVTATFEQAAGLPVVTRGHDVSAESVLSLRPDLVIAESGTGPAEAVDQIRAAGVPVLVVEAATGLDDVGPRIQAVAEALGVRSAGEELTRRTEERVAAVAESAPAEEDKPRVAFLYLRGSASVYLIGGKGSGATSLIEAAGAVDAGAESGLEKDFTAITSEALAEAAPDALLVMSKGLESVGGVDGLVKIPGIAQTPAGMDRRIVSVEDGVLLNYGPRTAQVLASVVEQLYGEGGAR